MGALRWIDPGEGPHRQPLSARVLSICVIGAAFSVSVASAASPAAGPAQGTDADPPSDSAIESMTVVAKRPRVFAVNTVSESMLAQQSPMSSVLAMVDNLPGVSIEEGGAYGFDDWSSSISMRGFQVHLDEAQIGTTIDGFPNGTSDYWSGSKANRFIDVANLDDVTVSQGTADVGSRSLEALGGTLDFTSIAPAFERGVTASVMLGSHDAERIYLRLDTGPVLGAGTRAWLSAVRQRSRDWVQKSVAAERDHLAAKFESDVGRAVLSGMVAYDDVNNASYQRLFSEDEFREDAKWDRLIDRWTDVPYVNQVYRPGWTIPRRNLFGYLKAELTVSESVFVSTGAYYHRMRGRGDWLPPYLVDVADDGDAAESELRAGTVRGGAALGRLYFVDSSGRALGAAPSCVSTLVFPYGGGGPEYDPACHPANAVPLQSWRHSHYGKERAGIMLDAEWSRPVGEGTNRLRAGLWYEDGRRDLGRDWHRILDARAGPRHDAIPYWHQYEWDFPQSLVKWHVENTFRSGGWTVSAGAKQYLVEVGREDVFGLEPNRQISSDSDVLFSGGVIYVPPIDGLELFAGYAENFKSLSDRLLEVPRRDLAGLNPETAKNLDIGIRYSGGRVSFTGAYYDIDFNNRVFFLSPTTVTGPNYLVAGGGSYFNAGGIESRGVELSATLRVTDTASVYAAYTWNDSAYVGTGDPLVTAAQGIEPGGEVVGVPKEMIVISLDWKRRALAAGLSTKYTSSRSVVPDGIWRTPAYWLTDAYVTVRLGPVFGKGNLTLSLVANNLWDKAYLSTVVSPGVFLGAPRTLSVSIMASL